VEGFSTISWRSSRAGILRWIRDFVLVGLPQML
jgi:hypothetical protein